MRPSSYSPSPNPNSTSYYPPPPPSNFGVFESTAFNASNRSFCSSDYSKARSSRPKPRLVKLRRRHGSQSKDSLNRANDSGVSGEFVNTVDFGGLNNVNSCDFDGVCKSKDTNLSIGTCGVGDLNRLDNGRGFVFGANAVKVSSLGGKVLSVNAGECCGEGRGKGEEEFVFGAFDGSRVSNLGLKKKECNLGFDVGVGGNGLKSFLHSEKVEGDGNVGNLFGIGDGNLATSVGQGGKVDDVGPVFGCPESGSSSVSDAKFEKSRATVEELNFFDTCKENTDSEMERPDSKVDSVFQFGSAGLCQSSWLGDGRNKFNVEKCNDEVKEEGDTMHSVANCSINFVFGSSSGLGNDLRRRHAVKLSNKMQKMSIHESHKVDGVDTCKDSSSISSINLDIKFVFGSDKRTSVSTTGSSGFNCNQTQYSRGTAPESNTVIENSEINDIKNGEEQVAGSFGEGVEGKILDATRNRNTIFGAGLFGEQNIPSCSTSETLGKENQPINLAEKIMYGKQYLWNKLNYECEVNKSSYPYSSMGFHFQPGNSAHKASTGDRIQKNDTEHIFTSTPVQSGPSFTGFNTSNVDNPANLFTGLREKLDFGTSDRSTGGRRLKKTRGKVRKPTSVKNEKTMEHSSWKNEGASDCCSPMDFSPCQEGCTPSPTHSNISTKAADEGLAATRERSDIKEGGSICRGPNVGGLKDLGETQLQFEMVDNVSADVASTEVGVRNTNDAKTQYCFASNSENHDESIFSTSSSSRQSNISATKPKKKYRMKIGRGSDSTSSSWRAELSASSVDGTSSCLDEPQTQKVGILNTQSRVVHSRLGEKQGKQDLNLAEILEECEKWRIRGNQAYKKGSLSKAENLYTKCIDSITQTKATECCIEPLVLCYSNRAATRLSLGKIREAIEDCKKAASFDPNFQKTLLRAAKCHLVLGELEDAKHYFNKCLESGVDVCLDRRIMIEAAEGLQKSEKVVKCMNDSAKFLQERTPEAVGNALTIIIEALAISSYSEKLLKMKGEALCMLRKYEEVVQLCEQTLEFAEKNFITMEPDIQLTDGSNCKLSDARVWRWRLMSQSYFHMGRLEASLELIKKREKLRYVEDKYGSEENNSLVTLADKLCELLHLKNAGNKAFQCGKHTEAVDHYTAAILNSLESYPFAAVCFCNRAAAHQALGNISDAIADCSLAIALDGSYGKALSRRATLHEMIRDYEQAANDLQRFISVLQMQSKEMNKQSDTPLGKCGSRENLQEARDRLFCLERKAKKGIPLDFYLILGIKSSDNASDIKKAYHKAALKHHPDKAGQFLAKSESADEGQLRKELAEKTRVDADRLFKMIGEAYAVLSDNNKRSAYDVEEEIRNEKAKNKGSSSARESKIYSPPFVNRSSREYGRDWRTYAGESWRTYGKSSYRW